jgi:endonuclease YncB( thermonuclease family)
VTTWEGAKANMTRCIVAPVTDFGDTLRDTFAELKTIGFPEQSSIQQLIDDFKTNFGEIRRGIQEFDIPALAQVATKVFVGNSGIKDFIDQVEAAVAGLAGGLLALGLTLHQCGYSTFALAVLLMIILMANPVGWLILALKVILTIAVIADLVVQFRRGLAAYREGDWFVFGVAAGIILGNLFDLITVAKSDLLAKSSTDSVNGSGKYTYRTEKGKLVTELKNPPAEMAGNARQYGKTVKQQYTAEVVKVYDGDTITVLKNGKQVKIRFAGIDAPEMAQPGGPEAQKTLQALIDKNGGKVKVMSYGTDLYGRETADIFAGKAWAQSELLAKGQVWHYRAYDSRKHLDDLLRAAQKSKLGLWSGSSTNVAPWDFRKGRNIKAVIPKDPKDMAALFPDWVGDLLSIKKMFRTLVPSLTEIIDWAKDVLTAAPIDEVDIDIPTPDACLLDPKCASLIRLRPDQTLASAYAPQNGTKTLRFTRSDRFKVELRTSFGAAQAVVTDGDRAWAVEVRRAVFSFFVFFFTFFFCVCFSFFL